MTHHVAGFSKRQGRGRGARASERFDGAIGGDPARARSSEDVRSASHASSTDRSGRRSRALGRSIRARIAQLEKHTVVEGLLGSGFAGTLRACRDARYAPACRRRIGEAPRGSRRARGRPWPGRERRRSVGRRPGGRRPARARSREREQPSARFPFKPALRRGGKPLELEPVVGPTSSFGGLKPPATTRFDAVPCCVRRVTSTRAVYDVRRYPRRCVHQPILTTGQTGGPFQRCNRHGTRFQFVNRGLSDER